MAASVAVREPHAWPRRPETWSALGYSAVVGSVLVFLLYIYVLQHWTASRASYGFVLTPIVTVLVSALLDGEQITANLLLGGVFVLTGVYIGISPQTRSKAALPASSSASGSRFHSESG